MKKGKIIAIIACVAMLFTLLTACTGGGTQGQSDPVQEEPAADSRYGGVANIVYGNMDDHLDINAPGASAGTHFWARYIYESALAVGTDGKLYPLVCEYSYDETDYTWMKLWVREGVTFHDGAAVTIDDVLASYLRNTKRNIMAEVVDYSIEDGVLTLNFNDKGCISTMYWWGYYTPDYGIMPKRIVDMFPAGDTGKIITDPQYVVGTGAYKIIPGEYTNQELVAVERYEGYVPYEGCPDGMGQASPRRAYLDRINCIVNTDQNNRLMHLLNGDYDVITMDVDTFNSTLEPLGYSMYRDTSDAIISDNCTLIFNLHDNSTSFLKDDPNLRKAILAAVDMDEVCYANYSDWYGDYHSPVLIDGYSTAAFDNADYCGAQNLTLAKEYLEKSNYNGETIILRRPSTAGMNSCLKVKENLEAAGIKCEIDPIEASAYVVNYRDGTSGWDMYMLFGQGTAIWPGLMPVNNYVCWTSNEQATELRNKLFSYPTGTDESIAYWEEYSQLMADEVPCFCLGKSLGDRYVQASGINPNYQGYMNYINAYWDNPEEHMG